MSKQIETFAVESAEIESPQNESALVETSEQTRRLSLWERGMTTVEWTNASTTQLRDTATKPSRLCIWAFFSGTAWSAVPTAAQSAAAWRDAGGRTSSESSTAWPIPAPGRAS